MTKILLVEDDKSLREIYGVRLLAEGYDIVSAGDGEEALAMAIKERPELIISDVMMPKISGFDMLDILRSTTETRDIRVIMMTALSSDDQRARGEQLGADKYLVKSQVGIEDVVRTVHEVMEDASKAAGGAAAAPAADDATPDPAPTMTPAPSDTQNSEATLPQPTAPFSSPKPDNLGERVINPIVNSNPAPSIANKIENELADTPAPASVPEPAAAPAPLPPLPPQPASELETAPAEEPVVAEPVSAPAPEPAAPVADDATPEPSDDSAAAPADDSAQPEPETPASAEPASQTPAGEPQAPAPETPDNEQRAA